MTNEIFTIVDQKNKDGEFLCEKIINSSEFQEGKDYVKERENAFRLLSYKLKRRILNRNSSSNNVGVISDKIYRVLVDKGNSLERKDKKNIDFSPTKSSDKEIVW